MWCRYWYPRSAAEQNLELHPNQRNITNKIADSNPFTRDTPTRSGFQNTSALPKTKTNVDTKVAEDQSSTTDIIDFKTGSKRSATEMLKERSRNANTNAIISLAKRLLIQSLRFDKSKSWVLVNGHASN